MILTKFYRSDQQRALESVVIGAVARTNAVVTLIPITVLKTRYEVCISRMTVYCHYSDHYNLDNCFQMLINLYILMLSEVNNRSQDWVCVKKILNNNLI